MIPRPLIERIVALGSSFAPPLLEELADRIEQQPSLDAGCVQAVSARTVNPALREQVHAIFEAAVGSTHVTPAVLAAMLRTSVASLSAMRHDGRPELVWTGTALPGLPTRRTEQALVEVIESAHEELWIASFAAFSFDSFFEALAKAAERGVRAHLLLEEHDEGTRRVEPERRFLDRLRRTESTRRYEWARERRTRAEGGRAGLMHAKVVLADGSIALITSANLTDSAMILNMEVGVLIHGGQLPRTLQALFRRLVTEAVIVPID